MVEHVVHDVEVADRCTGREISNYSEALIPSANSIAINLPYEEASQLRTDAFEYAFLPACRSFLDPVMCPVAINQRGHPEVGLSFYIKVPILISGTHLLSLDLLGEFE